LLLGALAGSRADELEKAISYCRKLGVSERVMRSIAEIEGYKKNGVLYPYIIRVNSPFRILGLKEVAPNVYDCRNEMLCRYVAEKLVRAGAKNIDLGVFQINYYHYRGDKKRLLADAFNYAREYRLACEIVADLFRKYGKNLYAIGRYHSANPERMRKYAARFIRAYRKIKIQ